MKTRFLTFLLGLCSFVLMSATSPNIEQTVASANPEIKVNVLSNPANQPEAKQANWEKVYREIEAKKGGKLSWKEKLAFKLLKKKAERAEKKNAQPDGKKKAKAFDAVGFILGLFLGIIGVVLAYVIDKEKYIPSAWYGFAVAVILYIVLFAVVFSAATV